MNDSKQPSGGGGRGFLATGGLLGAMLTSSCCIVPLLLVMLGVGGIWIGSLAVLAPYQWIFLLIAVTCLGAGFWQVYFMPKTECIEGDICDNYTSNIAIKSILWIAAILVIVAIASNILAL